MDQVRTLVREFRKLFTKKQVRRVASMTRKYGIDMMHWSTGEKG